MDTEIRTTKEIFIHKILDEIFELYNKLGNEEYGEKVTMLMHMMQSALCAEKENASNELIVAAFLHDIGHFLEGQDKMGIYGTMAHDDLGKQYLVSKGFPEKLGNLVASHVNAKRYLTAVEKDYMNELSEASKQTLLYQGGPMDLEEVKEFESDPYYKEYVQIRRWDDLGKDTEMKVLPQDMQRMRSRIQDYLMENWVQSESIFV